MVRAALIAMLCLATDSATGAVLCTGRAGSGTLRVRAACKASEVQVDPASLGLQGPPGATGPGLVVKDANGAVVGVVIEETTSYGVNPVLDSLAEIIGFRHASPPFIFHLMQAGREIAGTHVRLTVSPDGFVPIGSTSGILFDGPDCAGQAYFDTGSVGSPLLLPRFFEQGWVNGTVLYYRPHGSGTVVFTQRSSLAFPVESFAGCPAPGSQSRFVPPAGRCCTDGFSYTVEAAPLNTLDLSSLGLVPPFHVEGP